MDIQEQEANRANREDQKKTFPNDIAVKTSSVQKKKDY
jgi:hypothetical protein